MKAKKGERKSVFWTLYRQFHFLYPSLPFRGLKMNYINSLKHLLNEVLP